MDDNYKKLKEVFVIKEDPYSSSPLEVISITLINQWSFLLLHVILSCFPLVYESRSYERILLESCILFGPLILGVTVFSFCPIGYSCLLLSVSFTLLLFHRKIISTVQWTEVLLIPKKVKPTKIIPLTGLFRSLMLSTMVCILAVDFPIFHRKFSKNSQYGISLMDTGVGAFIALNGALSPESRSPLSNDQFLLKKSLTSSTPLLVIGVARMIAVRITNYNYNVSEYGVHWNFFVTVALVKVLSSFIFVKLRKTKVHFLVFPAFLLVVYQTVLSLGLGSYLLDDESRSNILSANKEGIGSVFGFIPLYLMSLYLGQHFYSKRRTGKSIDYVIMTVESGVLCLVSGLFSTLCHSFIQEVSRRQSNAAYILWIICLYSLLLAAECLIHLTIEFMQSIGLLRLHESSQPILSSCFDSNSLVVFLLANLLTGMINLSSDTMEMGSLQSLSVLFVYSIVLSLVSSWMKQSKIQQTHMIQMFVQYCHQRLKTFRHLTTSK